MKKKKSRRPRPLVLLLAAGAGANPAVNDNPGYASVSLGRFHTCGLLAGTQELVCWGYDFYGQATVPALHQASQWASVSLGGYHTCGLLLGGLLRCWGRNDAQVSGASTEANAFFNLTSARAEWCGLGFFQPAAGQTVCFGCTDSTGLCTQCDAGSFLGPAACQLCPAGRASAASNQDTDCVRCALGSFQC